MADPKLDVLNERLETLEKRVFGDADKDSDYPKVRFKSGKLFSILCDEILHAGFMIFTLSLTPVSVCPPPCQRCAMRMIIM